MENVTALDHPLVDHHLSVLRDATTPPETFRAALERLTFLLTYEATKDLPTTDVAVQTPVGPAQCKRVAARIGLVPILRAGLGMVDPVLTMLPGAEVWHLGFYRDEATLQPVEYYQKLPRGKAVDLALVVDPMLATGGSAVAAIDTLGRWGVSRVKLLAMIAAPEGLAMVHRRHPHTQVYVCGVDEKLNDKGYIVPGLGDAGDRVFNAATD